MLSIKGEVVVEVQEQADVQLLIKSEMAEIRPLSKTSGPDACILLNEAAGIGPILNSIAQAHQRVNPNLNPHTQL